VFWIPIIYVGIPSYTYLTLQRYLLIYLGICKYVRTLIKYMYLTNPSFCLRSEEI